ncbi:GGDEF domain-containing protein [Jatrophihabitans telluris]|uniref:GGDEF domain-containing protein n=1 Tax=Jatrophihabitans telluris TaxID=2038343 RepID=A0ABY4QVE1_9ACTN|nr:GGDEF domain-containing protein [Jatrophihabitans telluris]UQX87589.1 GGDEF domain-containing protein [Jatrophihabitans telluris]
MADTGEVGNPTGASRLLLRWRRWTRGIARRTVSSACLLFITPVCALLAAGCALTPGLLTSGGRVLLAAIALGWLAAFAHVRRQLQISDATTAVAVVYSCLLAPTIALTATSEQFAHLLATTTSAPVILAAAVLNVRLTAVLFGLACAMTVATQFALGANTSLYWSFTAIVLCWSLLATAVVVVLKSQLGAALARAQQLSLVDPLTGLTNRRGLVRRFPAFVARAVRAEGWIAILLADIDHFKQINDRLGHARGDEVLRSVAAAIARACRDEDLVVRMGGEELAVVAVIESRAEADRIGERLRASVERHEMPFPARVTVSIGVHVARPQLGTDRRKQLESMLDSADVQMYRAKAAGRNQVAVAS